jgi:Cof subfamily protein (haloacid dehalogenase superfamily)
MIKAVILDVDGVIVGEKKGFNFPEPHLEVIARLRAVKGRGIPISLCTAKPHYAVKTIIDDAGLDNIHITMAGGVMIDPVHNVVLEKHPLSSEKGQSLVQEYIKNNAYLEIYSVDQYFVQADQVSSLTRQHTEILQREPVIVDSLSEEILKQEVVKIMPIAKNEADKDRLSKLFEPYKGDLELSWGVHPFAAPHKFGNITAKGISKRQAASELAHNLNIKTEEILGVGDSTADWQFIELCGYAGAMGNASEDLKRLIADKGDQSFIGKTVDENGILGILDYFGL